MYLNIERIPTGDTTEEKKQQRFSEKIVMQHSKKAFGKIKLTVGVLKGNRQKVQYCITAIE